MYTNTNGSFQYLKGRDKFIADALCSCLDIKLYLADLRSKPPKSVDAMRQEVGIWKQKYIKVLTSMRKSMTAIIKEMTSFRIEEYIVAKVQWKIILAWRHSRVGSKLA